MLAVAGSLAIEGPVIRWVADHRRHHAFSDKEGDPHSPWRYGNDTKALAKGLWHAHIGWLFDIEQTNQERFAPDLLADPDIVKVNSKFLQLTAVTMLLPPLVGFIWSGFTWQGALTAFFWGSLVRVAALHHTTWSINSICHTVGERPFKSRDKSGNVWWLAVLSMGESWHNLHHADPTAARHGVLRGQVDSSARIIWVMEKLHMVDNVRWPSRERLATQDGRRVSEAVLPLPAQPASSRATRRSGPHVGQGASRAAARRRSQPVRREGLRRHQRRGDRGEGRRQQAGRLRALRRQGGPVRRRGRPRGASAARPHHPRAVR